MPAVALAKELLLLLLLLKLETFLLYKTSPILFRDTPWGFALLAGLSASLNECWYNVQS